jgi:hypothetical protein
MRRYNGTVMIWVSLQSITESLTTLITAAAANPPPPHHPPPTTATTTGDKRSNWVLFIILVFIWLCSVNIIITTNITSVFCHCQSKTTADSQKYFYFKILSVIYKATNMGHITLSVCLFLTSNVTRANTYLPFKGTNAEWSMVLAV